MIGAKQKIEDQTVSYDAVLGLCFHGNESIWERTSLERRMFEKLKRGELSIRNNSEIPAPVFTFFTGLILGAFTVFPSITNTVLRCEQCTAEHLVVVLEGARRLKIPRGSWSAELESFMLYYKQKILGCDKPDLSFERNDWQSLKAIFKYSQERLSGERLFLKGLIDQPKKIVVFLQDTHVRMDSLMVIISALPSEQLNMFFLEIAPHIPEKMMGITPDGLRIDIHHHFAKSSVDMTNLFGKIKMLLMLYARHEIVIDYVIEGVARDLLVKYLMNDAVRGRTLEQIEKTVYGQYQPRIDFAKAFAKVLS
jgi:hypothetical protein